MSVQFDDVYFSRDDGVAETNHVFLEQNDLARRWQDWDAPGSFSIGETGFGTGLNFFCVWVLWRQLRSPGQHLHFVSVEKFPLQPSDLRKACALRPEFVPLANSLLAQYPPLVKGLHRLHFLDDALTLTLVFDDAVEGLSQLEGRVDAWFLDGFAPARNPAMWQPALFAEMARLSHETTTFATFTAAGMVKSGLQEAGFEVWKHPGYGRKRDMLKGRFASPFAIHDWPASAQPWFRHSARPMAPGRVAVVGAGLAGCCAAHALALRGWNVIVLERESAIASLTSGNLTGITYARLSVHDTPQNRWYIGAYLHAVRFIRTLFSHHDFPAGDDWNLNGVLQLAHDADEACFHQVLQASGIWPESVARFLSASDVQAELGFACEHSGLMMKEGGWLSPEVFCRHLLMHPSIEVRCNFAVSDLQRVDGHWQIGGMDEALDAVVLANAFDAANLDCTNHLPLRPVRGQVSHVPVTEASEKLYHAVNHAGYVNPARQGVHCVGATFTPWNRDANERNEDHQHNLKQLRATLPALADALSCDDPAQLHGRVGFRCQTPDYQPLVGPLPDVAAFHACYDALRKGNLKQNFPACPTLPGLYITTAFGAKGITSAPLAAEILAAYVSGEPQPVDREVLHALHPARFLQRALKRSGPAP